MTETLEQQVKCAEQALQGGALLRIACEIAGPDTPVETPEDVANVLLPPRSQDTQRPRWQIAEENARRRELYEQNTDEILDLARKAGLRQDKSLPEEQLAQMQQDAVLVTEGGANRTSVVRFNLAMDAREQAGLTADKIFEPASNRPIPQFLADGRPNPEHKIALDLAPALPDQDLTEYEVKLAVAAQVGYEGYYRDKGNCQITPMHAEGQPSRFIILPRYFKENGLIAGITAVHNYLEYPDSGEKNDGLEGRQLVIATSGQYRTAAALKAEIWATNHGCNLQPTVAVGDEPGYTAQHGSQQFVTAERSPSIYVPEFVVISRLMSQLREARIQVQREADAGLPVGKINLSDQASKIL